MRFLNSKKKIVLLILVIIIAFVSCHGRFPSAYFGNQKQYTRQMFRKMEKAMKKQNQEAFLELFAKNIQNDELKRKIDELFAYIEGDVISCEYDFYYMAEGSFRHGERITKMSPSCYIETTEKRYFIVTWACNINTMDKNGEGILRFSIIEADKENDAYTEYLRKLDAEEAEGIYIGYDMICE